MISISTNPGFLGLRFRVFGTTVVIKVWFWLVMAVFGYFMGITALAAGNGPWRIAMWVLMAFVSTMIHEIGHVIAGRCFGYPGTIVLHAMGGGAVGEYLRAERWQRIIIAAAGPIFGLSLFLAVYLSASWIITRLAFLGNWEDTINVALIYLAFLSLFTNLSNLPPIMPMDGGMIAKDLSGYLVGSRDWIVGAVLSILTSSAIAAYCIYKSYHPDAPFLAELLRPLYPASLKFVGLAAFRPDPFFFAFMYGFFGVMNLISLFRGAPKAGGGIAVSDA